MGFYSKAHYERVSPKRDTKEDRKNREILSRSLQMVQDDIEREFPEKKISLAHVILKYQADQKEARLAEITRLVEKFEEETGFDWDPEGPLPSYCEYCGEILQYIPDHDCYGLRCASQESLMCE